MIVEIVMGSGAIASGEVKVCSDKQWFEIMDISELLVALSDDVRYGGYISVKDSNGVKLVNKRNILYVRRKR